MAEVTEDKNQMADDAKPESEDDAEREQSPLAPGRPAVGFFQIYKPGQGYWTRMCTAGIATLVLLLLCQWFYQHVLLLYDGLQAEPWRVFRFLYRFDDRENIKLWKFAFGVKIGLTSLVFLVASVFVWRYMNKPQSVDFLVETEKEMAKVNWTTRKELFGSTRVVIAFVVLITVLLFVYDLFFGYVLKYLHILKGGPFS
jgi:preprotein translocase SecE subunit